MNPRRIIFATAVFLVLFYNRAFFRNVLSAYPLSWHTAGFLFSQVIVLTTLLVFLFSLLSWKRTLKPLLILVVLLSSFAAYFMDTYGLIIDWTMIQNGVETNVNEASDLLGFKLAAYFIFLGLLPSLVIFNISIVYGSLKRELMAKGMTLGLSLLVIVGTLGIYSASYASFFREHKALRYYTNPTYFIYAFGQYLGNRRESNTPPVLTSIGLDAKISEGDLDRELIVLVVGETARADRFSLNGYAKKTNPRLEKEGVVSFRSFYSCGTSTAVSVPCLFSFYKKSEYSEDKRESTENILDVLKRAGVNVLWRDNNSDSKGVALRVAYQDFRTAELNPICDIECRDIGMLSGLQEHIDRVKEKDILIVLHQMGNHGPAYYKRYPESFEAFGPACRSIELRDCSALEIDNAYDNAILYTDYFLSEVVALLKRNDARFETALFYVSDHGESLGENNLYLHGLPFLFAPDEQKHVGAIMWFGDSYIIDRAKVIAKENLPYSHDHIFHTLLGFMEVGTAVYDPGQDILSDAYSGPHS